MQKKIREPIVGVLGHVDHGKTTLLDYVRKSTLALKEPGRITQDIGATNIPLKVIKEVCGELFKPFEGKIEIPGLLFIDTPGHEAFTTLREKGGALSDLAILVIDINEGIKNQTKESLEILRKFKTPFLIALTKIDKISGWLSKEKDFTKNYRLQNDFTKRHFEERLYSIISQLSEFNFDAELFFEVKDFTKQVCIVPCSGITGEGIPNLFLLLLGLSQKFLKNKLFLSDNAKGIVLEVKKDKTLGVNIDVILYDGVLSVGDKIAIGGKDAIITKVRGILVPERIMDIRAEKKFLSLQEVTASAGVKIIAKDLEKVVPGSPLQSIKEEKEVEELIKDFKEELTRIEIDEEREGIVLRANNIGSLEALITLFKNRTPIKRAKIGPPTKEDIIELDAMENELCKVLILFGVEGDEEIIRYAKDKGIEIIESDVIYHIVEKFDKWKEEKEKEIEKRKKEGLPKIAKIKILEGYVFRQSNPAIVGVEVLEGVLTQGAKLINSDGKIVSEIKQIQVMGKSVKEILKGEQGAVSLPNVTVGRQIKEGEILYIFITKEQYRELKKELKDKEVFQVLDEIKRILGYL